LESGLLKSRVLRLRGISWQHMEESTALSKHIILPSSMLVQWLWALLG